MQNQELTVSIQIQDKAGHTSQPVTLSALVLSGQIAKSPPAGIFKENELGPIMVTLQPPSGQNSKPELKAPVIFGGARGREGASVGEPNLRRIHEQAG
ncbi:MAG: hypothetical protein HXY45_18880 [Syntrophaceae bacterium]|nr:hypothetical protein [Syntrophaceae bacterium]